MLKVMVTGLFNRGQQDEYVELEAAARCSLEGLMLVRFVYNEEGFPIYSKARLYEFPDTNLRKGNRVRLYSGFTKEKKVRTPEGVTYNFSWNLEAPIWDGTHVEAHVIETCDRHGICPTIPLSDMPSPEERGTLSTFSEGLGKDMAKAMVEGRMQVIDPELGIVPVEITGIPEEEKVFFENGDFEGLLKHLQETGQLGEGKVVKKVKKDKKTKKGK